MKQILILLTIIAFVFPAYTQTNTNKPAASMTSNKLDIEEHDTTLDAKRVTPASAYYMFRDSIIAVDTSINDFNHGYIKTSVTIYNANVSTADTVQLFNYSTTKLGWTTQQIGLRRQSYPKNDEPDLTTIIIPANTALTFDISMFRPGKLMILPKTAAGRDTTKKCYIGWNGVN